MKTVVIVVFGFTLILCGYLLFFYKDEKKQPATKSGSYLLFTSDHLYIAPDETFVSKISFHRSCKIETDWEDASCITLSLVATTKGFVQWFEIPYPSGSQIQAFWTPDSAVCIVLTDVKTIYLLEPDSFNDHSEGFKFVQRTVEIDQLSSKTREFILSLNGNAEITP